MKTGYQYYNNSVGAVVTEYEFTTKEDAQGFAALFGGQVMLNPLFVVI